MSDPIVIASAARTPIGGLLGDFAGLQAWELGAVAIRAAVERAGIDAAAVDEVLMGNCLMAGQGQAPARQAARRAGLPDSAGAVTLSKMCGSGMRAMMFAHDMLAAGSVDVMVAGGMESMTNAPHLAFIRKGQKYGATAFYDHMALDGLEDASSRWPIGTDSSAPSGSASSSTTSAWMRRWSGCRASSGPISCPWTCGTRSSCITSDC